MAAVAMSRGVAIDSGTEEEQPRLLTALSRMSRRSTGTECSRSRHGARRLRCRKDCCEGKAQRRGRSVSCDLRNPTCASRH